MSNPPPVKTPRLQDTLQLDRRARAMLKAMGIQWFWPSAPSSVAVAAPPAPAPAAAPAPVSEPTVYAPVATAARASVPPLRPVELQGILQTGGFDGRWGAHGCNVNCITTASSRWLVFSG